jgi:hypothetical protein
MQTAIINNREALETVQMQPIGKDSNGMAILGPLVVLVPGLNLVDSKKLDALAGNEMFAKKFNTKIASSPAPEQNPERVGRTILEIVTVSAKDKDGKIIDKPLEVEDKLPLHKLTGATLTRVISETMVASTLRQWLTEENRGDVRSEIEARLKYITGQAAGPGFSGGPAAYDR